MRDVTHNREEIDRLRKQLDAIWLAEQLDVTAIGKLNIRLKALIDQPSQGLSYFDELTRAMGLLAKDPKIIFMGQSVAFPGTAMFRTLVDVPKNQLLELPVAEDMQMGMAIGMSLAGYLPICIFPRWNFLLLALNQLVNHLDKLPLMSKNGYRPKVIIRTAIATPNPLDPGPQHLGDYTAAVSSMLSTVNVVRLEQASEIVVAYDQAIRRDNSSLIVERMDCY